MQYGYAGSRYNDLYDKYPKPPNPVDQIGPALDTVNPRPSYEAASGGNTSPNRTGFIPSPTTTPATPAAPATPGSTSPELAGLVHSIQTPVTTTVPAAPQAPVPAAPAPVAAPVAPPPAAAPAIPAYLQPLIDAIPGLANPLTSTIDPAAMEAITNQVTRGNQRASNLAAEQLREKMAAGSGGLVAPGESGLADTALGGIYRGGASDTARTLGDISAEGARSLPQLNLKRLLAGGQLGQMLSGEERAGKEFDYQQEMDALNYLMSLYGAEQGYQQNAWSPFYSGIVNAYGG